MQFVVGGGYLDCQYQSCLGGGSKPAGHNGIRCGPYYNVNHIATYFLPQTAECKYVYTTQYSWPEYAINTDVILKSISNTFPSDVMYFSFTYIDIKT